MNIKETPEFVKELVINALTEVYKHNSEMLGAIINLSTTYNIHEYLPELSGLKNCVSLMEYHNSLNERFVKDGFVKVEMFGRYRELKGSTFESYELTVRSLILETIGGN